MAMRDVYAPRNVEIDMEAQRQRVPESGVLRCDRHACA